MYPPVPVAPVMPPQYERVNHVLHFIVSLIIWPWLLGWICCAVAVHFRNRDAYARYLHACQLAQHHAYQQAQYLAWQQAQR